MIKHKKAKYDIFQDEDFFKVNVDMSKHLSFRCGGIAKYFFQPKNVNELKKALWFCRKNKLKYFILGNGTNVICPDEGYDGAIISLKKINEVYIRKNIDCVEVCADAGVNLYVLNKTLAENYISGLEWSYGIPASMGGATYMNAGAYGNEMSEVITSVEVLKKGRIKTLKRDDINFSYRHSGLDDCIILRTWLKLDFGDKNIIEQNQKEFMQKRLQSQPLDFPNAGSVFKRTARLIPAKLIDNMGFKGVIIGKAQVSEKHAGFIVNLGGATSADIISLIEKIKTEVKEKTGETLESEIVILK